MSGRTLRTLGAAYLFSSLVFVAAAIATHFLGQAILESMAGVIGAILLLGVS